MAWGKVDDKLHASVKWRRATKGARALWTTALSWCSDQENDGSVPRDMLRILDGTRADAQSLVHAGLWHETDAGWIFNDWADYNPDSATLKAKREAESKGGKRGNHARWHVKQGISVPECEFCAPSGGDSGTRSGPDQGGESGANPPVPTRPDPTQPQEKTESSLTQFEEFWDTYDKKVGRKKVEQKWKTLLRRRDLTADQLIDAARVYVAAKRRAGEHPQFTKDPLTWLNGEHWTDDVTATVTAVRPTNVRPASDDWMQST